MSNANRVYGVGILQFVKMLLVVLMLGQSLTVVILVVRRYLGLVHTTTGGLDAILAHRFGWVAGLAVFLLPVLLSPYYARQFLRVPSRGVWGFTAALLPTVALPGLAMLLLPDSAWSERLLGVVWLVPYFACMLLGYIDSRSHKRQN